MDILKMKDMKSGWFVGDFTPTAFKTKEFEVSYKHHTAGEQWETHYHKQATEINFLIKGKMMIQNSEINSGDIFVLHPYEIANPIFIEDCDMVVVKTPSVVGDKFVINN